MLSKILKPLVKIQKKLEAYQQQLIKERTKNEDAIGQAERQLVYLDVEDVRTDKVLTNINKLLGE